MLLCRTCRICLFLFHDHWLVRMNRYQDYQASDIPVVQEGGVCVRVMAGTHSGTTGPIEMRNPGLLMDVTLTKGSTFVQEVRLDNPPPLDCPPPSPLPPPGMPLSRPDQGVHLPARSAPFPLCSKIPLPMPPPPLPLPLTTCLTPFL